MKKTLIALAAVAATGAAFAQSSVTLYGVMDIGYGMKKWSAGGETVAKSNGVVDGAMAGNRFGFRGTEDLGGGLKAEFVIEQGLSPTSQELTNVRTASSGFQADTAIGTSALLDETGAVNNTVAIGGRSRSNLNRQSFIGLSGGFGTVRLGYQYTSLYELGTLSGYTQTMEGVHGGDFAHLAGFAWVGGTRANGVSYVSPSFGGLTVSGQFGGGTNTLNSFTHSVDQAGAPAQFKNERTSIMAKYAAGPISASVAYTRYKNGNPALNEDSIALASLTNLRGRVATADVTQLGASYDLGMAKIGFTYNDGDNGRAAGAAQSTKGYGFGVTVPMGALSFIAGFQNQKVNNGEGANTLDTKATGWQLGAVYALSKRTTAYAFTGTTTTKFVVDGTDPKIKQNDFVVGVRHTF